LRTLLCLPAIGREDDVKAELAIAGSASNEKVKTKKFAGERGA